MVALPAPLRVTVAPLPLAAGLTVPEMLHCGATTPKANVLDPPPEAAVKVAVCDVATEATVAVKVPAEAPAATLRLAGTLTLVLLLDNTTLEPPARAAELSVTVHAAEPGAVTLAGLQVRPLGTGGAG